MIGHDAVRKDRQRFTLDRFFKYSFECFIEFDEFLALSKNFGQSGGWGEGDFDGDGTVDFPDFLVLSKNFAREANASAAAVPETTGRSITMFGLLGLIGFRKRI